MTHTALQKLKISNIDECKGPNVSTSRYTIRKIFKLNQKLMLVVYAIKCSKMNYGMTCKQFRQQTYGSGKRLQSKFPSSWIDSMIAGID